MGGQKHHLYMQGLGMDVILASGKNWAYPEDITIIAAHDGPLLTLADEVRSDHHLCDPEWDSRKTLSENMIATMLDLGVLQEITVKLDGKRLVCEIGRDRTVHLREANKRLKAKGLLPLRIPYKLSDDDEKTAGRKIRVENHHRRNDATPSLIGREVVRLRGRGVPDEEIREELNIDKRDFSAHIALAGMIARVRAAVDSGRLAFCHIDKLRGLAEVEQGAWMDRYESALEGEVPTEGDDADEAGAVEPKAVDKPGEPTKAIEPKAAPKAPQTPKKVTKGEAARIASGEKDVPRRLAPKQLDRVVDTFKALSKGGVDVEGILVGLRLAKGDLSALRGYTKEVKDAVKEALERPSRAEDGGEGSSKASKPKQHKE